MKRRSGWLWMMALSLMLLGGCSSPHHRKVGTLCEVRMPADLTADWEPLGGECHDRWAVRAPTHGVNYVEIDEQGILHDRQAAEDALAFAGAPPTAGKMAYVVVFIHGWHHSAESGDSNVQAFHRALASVSRWRPEADVRGIYIGWRGSSLPIPGLRYLTFWERKNTSDEIGRGALLEFLLRLERSVKPQPGSKNRLVLIGHSFGASVAFNALAHVHMQRFIEGLHATTAGERFRGYGDLTVLINPAIEAMRYMPLQSAVEYYATRTEPPLLDFSRETKPRLIILASDGDLATRCAFPAARLASTALEAHNRISAQKSPDEPAGPYVEWNMDRDTVGNFPNFRTHWPLRLVKDDSTFKAPSTFLECVRALVTSVARPAEPKPVVLKACPVPPPAQLRELLSQESADPDTPQQQAALPADVKVPGSYFPTSDIRVVRKPLDPKLERLRNSPYIVAGVGVEIVADHSSIASQHLICWINQLVDAD